LYCVARNFAKCFTPH
ncbi:Single-stranded DNA-binding protein, partial [Haemophilus influenzae]